VLINNFNIKIIKSEQEIAAVKLNTNDANLFKTTQGYPAISNTWYMYDKSNRLVLMDQELTIKPLKVENYYH
jgi:DNA-binding GntR family transcriptional regulator